MNATFAARKRFRYAARPLDKRPGREFFIMKGVNGPTYQLEAQSTGYNRLYIRKFGFGRTDLFTLIDAGWGFSSFFV